MCKKGLQDELRSWVLHEGANETGIPQVTAWRFQKQKIQMPETEHPYLYLVLDGMLRLHTPSGMMTIWRGSILSLKSTRPSGERFWHFRSMGIF